MRKRFVAIAFLLLAAFPPPSAAPSPVAHVAALNPAAGPDWQAFVDALRERGWVEGRNLVFELRSALRAERYPEIAAELVALRPDLIIANSSQATQAVREKTDTIPIVMIGVAEPIASRFAASLARPGGNVTGLSLQLGETNQKALQLLTETRPGISRIGLFWVPDNVGSRLNKEALVAIAPRLGVASNRSQSGRRRSSTRLLRRSHAVGRTACSRTPRRSCSASARRSLPLRSTATYRRWARIRSGRAPGC
jgi:ABC-type uncharacterized transport system substrate-binding protein